jgi:hypothetical protein
MKTKALFLFAIFAVHGGLAAGVVVLETPAQRLITTCLQDYPAMPDFTARELLLAYAVAAEQP